MKRIDFIKGLIGMGGATFLSGKFAEAKSYRKFYLLQSFIRGFRHYEGPELMNVMKEGDLLELVREPDNKFDPCAIALHWNKCKIGFLPAEDNEMLSKLLDIGIPELIAEIIYLKPDAASWENVNIAVYVLKEIMPGEEVPSTAAYLTELETPYYRTLKRADNTITRVRLPGYVKIDDELEEHEAYQWLGDHSTNDSVKHIIEHSVDKNADFGKQLDFLVVNKKRITPGLAEQFGQLESELYNVDQMFDEEGYIVLSVNKMGSYVDRISGINELTDKLGRKFLELTF